MRRNREYFQEINAQLAYIKRHFRVCFADCTHSVRVFCLFDISLARSGREGQDVERACVGCSAQGIKARARCVARHFRGRDWRGAGLSHSSIQRWCRISHTEGGRPSRSGGGHSHDDCNRDWPSCRPRSHSPASCQGLDSLKEFDVEGRGRLNIP